MDPGSRRAPGATTDASADAAVPADEDEPVVADPRPGRRLAHAGPAGDGAARVDDGATHLGAGLDHRLGEDDRVLDHGALGHPHPGADDAADDGAGDVGTRR